MRTIYVLGEHQTHMAEKAGFIPANRYIVGKTAVGEKTLTLVPLYKGKFDNDIEIIDAEAVDLSGSNTVVDHDIISIWEPGCKPVPRRPKYAD
jgi:hypothetical protein